MTDIEYTVCRSSRRKTAAIKVSEKGAEVRIPPWVSDQWVKEWVASRSHWIRKHQQRISQELTESCLKIEQGALFPFKGKDYQLQWAKGRCRGVCITDDSIELTLSSRARSPEPEQVRKLLIEWLKSQAEHYLSARMRYWEKVMGLSSSLLIIKGFRRKWGSCTSAGVVSLNWRLIFAEPAIIDYVVIHELAHLKHLNHGPGFWRLVEKYCPERLLLKEELQRKTGWLIW